MGIEIKPGYRIAKPILDPLVEDQTFYKVGSQIEKRTYMCAFLYGFFLDSGLNSLHWQKS